jgi:hypothetical protein
MAQVAEPLPSKHKALSSNPRIIIIKKIFSCFFFLVSQQVEDMCRSRGERVGF